ncbi:hypothetical protein D3C80_1827180 [compost metagenome]
MDDGQADGFFQQGAGNLHFKLRHQSGFRPLPTRQQLATGVEHLGIGHFLRGGDQCQRLVRRHVVVEHHRRFHGVADGAGDQVQVVIGVHPQGQHAQRGQ